MRYLNVKYLVLIILKKSEAKFIIVSDFWNSQKNHFMRSSKVCTYDLKLHMYMWAHMCTYVHMLSNSCIYVYTYVCEIMHVICMCMNPEVRQTKY